MKVKDAMHKGVDWVSPAKLMRAHDVGAIPFGENDRLVGMVTDRDIVCRGLAQDNLRCAPCHGARCDDRRNPLLP
jgi:predicted transcriptional regulator